MQIKDKTAIVTGASDEIGLALARRLAERGVRVALAARSIEKLTQLENEIPGSLAMQTDMCKPDEVRSLIRRAKEKFGRIDILSTMLA